MPSIITNGLRIFNSDVFERRLTEHPTYAFIGKDTAWADESIPDDLQDSDKDKVDTFSDIIALKRITAEGVNSVVPRVDWQSGVVYDQYDHRVNMVDGRKQNGERHRFYVLTDEFNVYKCLSNNSGAASTVKPTSQQVSDFSTPDGYTWKFMYTVRTQDVFGFMTQEWLPIYTIKVNDGSSQWQVQQNAVSGAIHHIDVDLKGSGYSALSPPAVVISGDGSGAEAIVEVNSVTGEIDRIIVTNPGSGYSRATATLTDTGSGIGASLSPIMSPAGGHGNDARLELGGIFKMVKVTLNGSEDGNFPITSFRRAGIVHQPMSVTRGSKVFVSNSDPFKDGDIVTGTTTGAIGRVRLVDFNSSVIWLDDVIGQFIQTESITDGNDTVKIDFVQNDVNLPIIESVAPAGNYIQNTGELLYISNREFVSRNITQTEEIKFIVSF